MPVPETRVTLGEQAERELKSGKQVNSPVGDVAESPPR